MIRETLIKHLPEGSALQDLLKYGTETHPNVFPANYEFNPSDFTPIGKYSVYADGLTSDELKGQVFPITNPTDVNKKGWSSETRNMYRDWLKGGQFSLGPTISHGMAHDFSEMEQESHEGPFVSYEQRYNENGEPFKVEVPRAKMDEFLRFTLKYTPEELKYLDRTDYQLISDTLQRGGKVDREFVDNLLFKNGVHGKYNSRAEMMFSEVVSNLYGILTDSPDEEDPTFKYPTYTYGDSPSCQYHLHSDDARVKDIMVISPYDAGSDDWKQDKDFLSGFMEVSQGTPIGKYEVVSED